MTPVCTKTRELIDDALDGRLDPADHAAFEKHVGSCPACASEWEVATSLRDSMLRIGLDPAPSGLRDSIAAEIRGLSKKQQSIWSFGRAAAAILMVVTIGWLTLRTRKTADSEPRTDASHRESEAAASPRGPAPALEGIAKAPASSSPQAISTVPGEAQWSLDGVPPSAPLARARMLLDAVSNGEEDSSGLVTPGVSPEHRLRQAEVLVLLHENVGALTDAISNTKTPNGASGEALGLAQLASDADVALEVFAEKDALAKARDDASDKAKVEKKDESEPGASALKVTRPSRGARASRAPAGGGHRLESAPQQPAFYVVSGPGAIGRVERVLADKGLRWQEIWLTERSENDKKNKLQEQDSSYRIVEVDVPEAGVNDLIGDLESLSSLALAPIGREAALVETVGGAVAGAGGGQATSRAAPRAPRRADPPASSDQPKSLGIRKLRLVLIAR